MNFTKHTNRSFTYSTSPEVAIAAVFCRTPITIIPGATPGFVSTETTVVHFSTTSCEYATRETVPTLTRVEDASVGPTPRTYDKVFTNVLASGATDGISLPEKTAKQ